MQIIKRHPLPSPGAWFAALFSLILLAALGLASLQLLSELTAHRSYEKLETLLNENRPSIPYLERYASLSSQVHPWRRIQRAWQDPLLYPGIDQDALQDLIIALGEIHVGRTSQAFAKIKTALPSINKSAPVDESLDSASRELDTCAQRQQTLQLAARRVSRDLEDAQRDLNLTIRSHSLVAQDLADLFSLKSAYGDRGYDKLLVYQNGLLRWLPMIANLPDDIADAAELRDALNQLGGKLNLEEANQQEAFVQRIASLRQTSIELMLRVDELSTAVRLHTERLRALRDEQRFNLDQASRIGRQVIRRAAEPERTALFRACIRLLNLIVSPQ